MTPVGVIFLTGLVSYRRPPRVPDGLPCNIILSLLKLVSLAAISSVAPSLLVRIFLFSYFLYNIISLY